MDSKRILIFTGDGKGKTTAALGMALRASGHGMHIRIIQFIKNDAATGEVRAIQHLPDVELVQTGRGFIPPPKSPAFAKHKEAAEKGLELAVKTLASGKCDLVILDEICSAVSFGLLDESAVIALVRNVPAGLCLVMTGRGATHGMIDLADTVTEMKNIKHAFDAEVAAQKGVEF